MGKRLLKGFCTAFSLYSAIPAPAPRWDRDSTAYALCFFPVVGAVIAGALLGWYRVCAALSLTPALFAAGAVLLPLLLSGGIHMDGLIDTADALASHAGPQRRLEILSDPHAGAFGVLGCCGYLLLSWALWIQIWETPGLLGMALPGFVLSRALNALTIAAFPCARGSGLVYTFSAGASKGAAAGSGAMTAAAVCGICIGRYPLWGSVGAVAVAGYVMLHRRMCLRGFGGNTGDLAGFLSQNIELLWLAAAALGGAVQ